MKIFGLSSWYCYSVCTTAAYIIVFTKLKKISNWANYFSSKNFLQTFISWCNHLNSSRESLSK